MSGIDRAAGDQAYGTIVVIGGGCYGAYYVRQLRRAKAAGAIAWNRVLVVDRDAACRVAVEMIPPDDDVRAADRVELVVDEWVGFLAGWLGDAAGKGAAHQSDGAPTHSHRDAIVPSPLMPHLLFDWVLARARERWPDWRIERTPLETEPRVPWQRATPGGTHYVSFAEWTCPVNCVEPRRCPVTRGPRDWSLPTAMRTYADEERRRGRDLIGPLVFHCTHRAYGVGMIDVRDVLAADRAVAEAGTSGLSRVLVGTMSHCHGALDLVTIAPAGS